MVSVTSWISGYARPMQSPSTTGIPSCAAMQNGTIELMPPISSGITALTRPCKQRLIVSYAWTISLLSGNFSISGTGEPSENGSTTSASSSSSSAVTSRMGP